MKFLATVQTVGVMFLYLGAKVVGAASVVQRDATFAKYQPDAIDAVLEVASELLAIQIVGAGTSLAQLKILCDVDLAASSRLNVESYNTNLIHDIFCAAADAETVPPQEEITALTTEKATEIWIIQAIGAVTGKSGVQKLCNLINVNAASAVGLNGDLVKTTVCNAAAVANEVASSGEQANAILSAPAVYSIAPVSTVVLPFVAATTAY